MAEQPLSVKKHCEYFNTYSRILGFNPKDLGWNAMYELSYE